MTSYHKEKRNRLNKSGKRVESSNSKILISLRGGGCGVSAHEDIAHQKYPPLPNDIGIKLKEYTNIIAEKASLLIDENQKEDALIALQWFHFNKQHLNTLCFKYLDASKAYDLILECLEKLLKHCAIYIRASGFLCIQILQICNDLLRIIFSFLIKDRKNKNRYLEETYVEQLKLYANQLENLLKVESSNIWITGVEFELSMINIALEHCPTNSKIDEELFSQFMNGMFESILQLSPSEELIKALINIGSQIIIDKYNKNFKHKIRKYEIFYFFETLKWTVINQLQFQYSVRLILNSLKDGYNQYVAKSKDWLIHFCWMKIISEILCFRPIIDRNDPKSSEMLNRQWNSLIQNKQIIPQSFNISQARVVLKLDEIQNREQNKILLNVSENSFCLFFRQLIDAGTEKGFRLWNDYVEFSFQQHSFEKSLDNLNSINQFLFGNFEIKQFQHQTKLFDETYNEFMKIHEKILQSFSNYQKEANKTQIVKQLYFDDINFHTKILKEKLLGMLQLNILEQFYVRLLTQKLKDFKEILLQHQQTMDQKAKDKNNDSNQRKKFKQNFDFDGKLIEDLNQIIRNEEPFQTEKNSFNLSFLELIKLITLVEGESEKITIFSTFEIKCQTINLKPFIKAYVQNKKISQEFQSKLIHLQKTYSQFFKKQLKTQKYNYTQTWQKFVTLNKENLLVFVEKKFKELFTHLLMEIKTVKIFNLSINLKEYQELNFYSCLLFENCNYFRLKIINIYAFIANKVQSGLRELCSSSYSTKENSSLYNESVKIKKDDLIKQQENNLFEIQKQRILEFFKSNSNDKEQQSIEIIKQFMLDLQSFSNEYIQQNSAFSKRTFQAIEVFFQIYHNQINQEGDQKEVIFKLYELNDESNKNSQAEKDSQVQKDSGQVINQNSNQTINTKQSQYFSTMISGNTLSQTIDNQDKNTTLLLEDKKQTINTKQSQYFSTMISGNTLSQTIDNQDKNKTLPLENKQKQNLKVDISPYCFKNLIMNLQELSQYNQALAVFYRSNQIYKVKTEAKNHEENNNLKEKLVKKFEDQLNKMNDEFKKVNLSNITITKPPNTTEPEFTLLEIKNFYDFVSILNDTNCQNKTNEEQLKNDQGEEELVLVLLKKQLNKIFEKKLQQPNQSQNAHKVRECLAFNLIRIQSIVPEPALVQFCQTIIQELWGKEKDNRVKNLLRNKEMINLQKQMFNSDLRLFSDRLKQGFQKKLENLQQLEQKISQVLDIDQKNQLKQQLFNQYFEFDEYIEGISEMGSKLDLSLLFLKEIRLKLTQISTKLEDISTTLTSVKTEIRKFTGRSYQDQLSFRKQTAIEQMQQYELRNVYIPLRTQEWNAQTGGRISGKKQMETYLISDSPNDENAEVNEFLYTEEAKQKDVLLIRGNAGSGKSRAALKIEEFLWKQQVDPNQFIGISIPIYVQLPTIREPRYNLLQQALEGDLYKFNKIQYNEFIQDFEKNQFKLILILDGYDEMKNDILQSNLYKTNRFINQESQQINNNCISEQFKLIITTRNEILSSKNYPIWFCGQNVQTLKEVELLQFDYQQNENYIREFAKINQKRCFLSIYENFTQNENFIQVWNEIQIILNQNQNCNNSDSLLSNDQIEQIMKQIKNKPPFCLATQQQINMLVNELSQLWSVKKYMNIIHNTQIQQLLTTPFMMDIVIQVLPNMIQRFSSIEKIKKDFEKHFIDSKKQYKKKQYLIQLFRKDKKQKELFFDNDQLSEQAIKNFENLEKINFFSLFSVDTNFMRGEDGTVIVQDWENMKIIKDLNKGQKEKQEEDVNKEKEKQEENEATQKQKQIEQIKIIYLGKDAYEILMTLKKQKITTYDFYDQFIEFYHQKQIAKLKQIGYKCNYDALFNDLQYFSEGLAKNLSKSQLTQINYKIKGKLQLQQNPNKEITTWEDYYFNDFDGDGEYKKVLRSCMLITQKGNTFAFTHKSVQEFFVAKYFVELFENLPIIDNFQQLSVKLIENYLLPQNEQKVNFKDFLGKNFDDMWFKLIIPLTDQHLNSSEFNLSSEHFHGSLRLMKNKLRNIYNIKDKLMQIVNLSKQKQFYIKAASNCLFLLSYIQEYLGDADLSNIQIENTKLNGATFFQSNLEGSKFNNVDLNQCNLNCTNLKNVQWENIPLQNQYNLEGHTSKINDIKIFQNHYAASCGDDTLILIWDLKNFKQIYKFSYHIKKVNQLEVFENGQKLASVGEDKYFMIYELKVGNFKKTLSIYYSAPLFSVTWIQILDCFLIGTKNYMIQIFYQEGNLKVSDSNGPFNKKVKAQALSPDQSLVAIGNKNDIIIYTIPDCKHKIASNDLQEHNDVVLSLKFFPNNINLVSGSADRTLLIWDLIKGEKCKVISGNNSSISSISILGQDTLQPQLLAFIDGKDIQILDIKAGKIINSISYNQAAITTAILTKNENGENYVLFGCDNFQIRYRSIESIALLKNEDAHLSEVTTLSISPDGLTVASGGKDKTIKIWDIETGKLKQELHYHQSSICQVKFSNLGKYLASISEDGVVLIWDANLYSLIKHIEFIDDNKKENNIQNIQFKKRAFIAMQKLENIQNNDKLEEQGQPSIITALISLDGSQYYSFAFANSNGQIFGIKNDKPEMICTYNLITCLDFSKQEQEEVIAIGCENGEIIIFSLQKNSAQETIQTNTHVLIIRLFQKENQLLTGHAEGLVQRFSYQKKLLQRWELGEDEISTINLIEEDQVAFIGSSNSLIYQINFSGNDFQLFNEEINYQVLAISSNGRYLAAAKNLDIFFWNLKNQKCQKQAKSHDEAISILCFSDSEKILASGADDDLIHIWKIENDELKLKLGTFYSHHAEIEALFFFISKNSEDILVSVSSDFTIAVWDIKEQEQILRLKTPDEIELSKFCKFNKSNIIAIGFECDPKTTIQIVKFEEDKNQFNKLTTVPYEINSISISNNDEILAVATISKELYFYQLDRNQNLVIQIVQKVGFEVLNIQFSLFQNEIMYLQKQDSLVVYNVKNDSLENREIVNEFSQSLISFSTNVEIIAYCKKSSLGIIKLNENNQKEYLLRCKDNSVTAFATSLNRQYSAVGKINGLITIWDLQNETYYHLEHHSKRINFLKFINQDELFSAGQDSVILIFNFKTKTKHSRQLDMKVQFISLDKNQTMFVGANLESSQQKSKELFLEFSDLEDMLAFRKKSGQLQFLSLKAFKFKDSFKKVLFHQSVNNTAIAFSKNNQFLAYGINSGEVVVVGHKKLTFHHHKDYITSLNFYSQNLIISGSNDKTVCVSQFQNENWELLNQFTEFSKPIFNIYCQPNLNLIAVCDQSDKIFLYSVEENKKEIESYIFDGHQSEITSVIISPCGNFIVSASNDSCIKMWRSTTNKEIQSNKLLDFKDNLICYKTIGIEFPFEAQRVQKEKSIIRSQKNEDLTSRFK